MCIVMHNYFLQAVSVKAIYSSNKIAYCAIHATLSISCYICYYAAQHATNTLYNLYTVQIIVISLTWDAMLMAYDVRWSDMFVSGPQ